MYASIELDPNYNQFRRHMTKVFLTMLVLFGSFYPNVVIPSFPSFNTLTIENPLIDNYINKTKKIIIKEPVLYYKRVAYLNRVSAYNAVSWQTDSNPNVSACGPNLPQGQIALSQNLFFKPNGGNRCGQHVIIHLSNGQVIKGVVWDTMNSRYYNAADILMPHIHEAIQFGVHSGSLTFVTPRIEKVNIAQEI